MNRRFLAAMVAGAALAAIAVARPHAVVPGTPVAARLSSTAARPPASGPAASSSAVSGPAASSTEQQPPHEPGKPSCASASDGLAPRQRLAQLLMVGVPGGRLDDAVRLAGDVQVGGLFVHADPTVLLTGGRLARVQSAAKIPVTVAVDEEGGRVQSADPLAGSMPSARRMATTMTPEQVRATAANRAKFLSAAGVTMDFAPVVDVTDQPAATVIGDRSFSGNPHTVTRYASAFATGLSSAGVLPVLKHFPGHGSAKGDSHKATVVTPPLPRLEGVDLVPYQDLGGYGPVAVMLGHLVVPDVTGGEPATLSPAAYRLLREKYRFNGLTVTDDLGAMRAVSARYDLPTAVLRAITAGADVALWSSGARTGEVLDRLEAALRSGELPADRVQQATSRVLASKGVCV